VYFNSVSHGHASPCKEINDKYQNGLVLAQAAEEMYMSGLTPEHATKVFTMGDIYAIENAWALNERLTKGCFTMIKTKASQNGLAPEHAAKEMHDAVKINANQTLFFIRELAVTEMIVQLNGIALDHAFFAWHKASFSELNELALEHSSADMKSTTEEESVNISFEMAYNNENIFVTEAQILECVDVQTSLAIQMMDYTVTDSEAQQLKIEFDSELRSLDQHMLSQFILDYTKDKWNL
jgi:hypothetical protein